MKSFSFSFIFSEDAKLYFKPHNLINGYRKKLVYMLGDDSDDRYFTTSTIEELNLPIEVLFFSKSYQLLEFFSTAKKSSLILVDYNSTPDNGLAVLTKIKAMDVHKGTPVIILSDSSVWRYRDECYSLGTSSFIEKPSRLKKTKEVIQLFFLIGLTLQNFSFLLYSFLKFV